MFIPSKGLRVVAGLVILAGLLVGGFALLVPWMHRWGSTPAERARTLPGDDLAPDPMLVWDHALSIDAPPQAVWPWIAQIGDDRGGFYSYTFIENLFDSAHPYRNANRIIPELQDPRPGEGLIVDFLQVREVAPGRYLLAAAAPDPFWVWVWHLEPAEGDGSRLQVRLRIALPAEAIQAVPPIVQRLAMSVVHAGGFVMERKMMSGIRLRAEGGREPEWLHALEIFAWLAALGLGIAAAVLFVGWRGSRWWLPLAAAGASVAVLFWFTYGQPALWLRAFADLALLAALILGRRWERRSAAAGAA